MSTPAEDLLWRELDAFARRLEPHVRAAFFKAIQRLQAELTPEELEQLVRTADPRPILNRLELGPFQYAVRDAVAESAGAAVPSAGLPLSVHFDMLNPTVVRVLQASELALVSGVQSDIAAGIRQALIAGARNGINPVDTARQIRPLIGLTTKQVQSVANYRQLLTGGAKGQPYAEALRRATRDGRFDRTLQRAIDDRVPLKPEQVDAQVARFEERLLKQRAETLARTETITALWRGQHLRWQQAIDEGKVTAKQLRRFWHVAKDERVCPVCKDIPPLNPEGVAFEQPFETPDGPVMGPAAHPNCRCVVFVKMDFAQS